MNKKKDTKCAFFLTKIENKQIQQTQLGVNRSPIESVKTSIHISSKIVKLYTIFLNSKLNDI